MITDQWRRASIIILIARNLLGKLTSQYVLAKQTLVQFKRKKCFVSLKKNTWHSSDFYINVYHKNNDTSIYIKMSKQQCLHCCNIIIIDMKKPLKTFVWMNVKYLQCSEVESMQVYSTATHTQKKMLGKKLNKEILRSGFLLIVGLEGWQENKAALESEIKFHTLIQTVEKIKVLQN